MPGKRLVNFGKKSEIWSNLNKNYLQSLRSLVWQILNFVKLKGINIVESEKKVHISSPLPAEQAWFIETANSQSSGDMVR